MLKNVLKYSVLILAIFLWLQAYFPAIYTSTKLFPDDYRHGDLYRLSYLPQFKEKTVDCHKNTSPQSAKLPVHLYIIGDSFTEDQRVNKSDFLAEKYQYVHWANIKQIKLDSTKKNILILESVERAAKEHLSQDANNFQTEALVENTTPQHYTFRQTLTQKWDKVKSVAFPAGTEERLEHTLFNYDYFLWFRELKAKINLALFNRIEPKVILSKNQKHLFYFEEADSTHGRSSFFPVTEAQIDTFVTHTNNSREKYLKVGFDEVYLSIIPNKVSLQSPDLGNYNHLIERIQSNPKLSIPVIDTYHLFKKYPEKYYLKSDTHWNCEGRDLWLGIVNQLLTKK